MEAARRDNTLSGRVLEGRYRIVDELGEGGMGTVYRAEHLKLGRMVALKVLLADHGEDATLRARFEREAKALAAMSHPNVVTVTDYGMADELPYLVMEMLKGRTLKDRLSDGPIPPDEAFRITREMLRGLAYAHAEGVAHRDLKPGNVFLQALPDGSEHVKLLDFGLAKFVAGDAQRAGPALTRLGSVLGTPAYMAPEQATGESSDMRSDVYAAGILFLEMLSGEKPFDGDPGDVLRQQLVAPLPSLTELCPDREGSPALESFLAQATAKAPAARWENATEMLAALDAIPHPAVRGVSRAPSRTSDVATRASGSSGKRRVSPTAPTVAGSTPGASTPKREAGGTLAAILGAGALLVVAIGVIVVGVVIWASIGSEDGDASAEQPARAEGDETIAAGGRVPEGEASARDEGAWGQAAETAEVVAPSAVESEGESEARTEAETGPDPEMPPEDPATRATGQPNPWAGPTPRLLADVKRALDRGQRVSSRTDGRLLAHARDNRSDPRPQILLGRMYLARGWRPDAMERFEVAYRTSPTAAGDPRMLDALVLLAAHRATANRAATLMRDAYGVPRSIEAIDAALATGRLDRESTDRLGRVRQALQ